MRKPPEHEALGGLMEDHDGGMPPWGNSMAKFRRLRRIGGLSPKVGPACRQGPLNNVMKNVDYGIQKAIVLCNDNLKTRGSVTYAPIYMLMFIEKLKDDAPKIFKPDLTGLV